jgi:hypothetical protein
MAPTEMSSSPEIISNPSGMAMTPRFAATFSQLAMPAGFRKVSPPKMAKKIRTAIRPSAAPASGRRNSPPMDMLGHGSSPVRMEWGGPARRPVPGWP